MIKIELSEKHELLLRVISRRRGSTPQLVARGWVLDALDVLDVSSVSEEDLAAEKDPPFRVACLVPGCVGVPRSRGLCFGHYRRVRYYIGAGKITEAWCIRNGRILPKRGESLDVGETKDPSDPPNHADDTRWIFGWPHAQQERERRKDG